MLAWALVGIRKVQDEEERGLNLDWAGLVDHPRHSSEYLCR
jgi:hypothetical protein